MKSPKFKTKNFDALVKKRLTEAEIAEINREVELEIRTLKSLRQEPHHFLTQTIVTLAWTLF